MATISCDPTSLAAASKCFCGLSEEAKRNIELYLLTVIAGVPADPTTLLAQAKCFCGVSDQAAIWIRNYLLCVNANK